ncbi:MAG: hypothetical protein A2Y73_03330 [Chloroflexi bacterium RBG_13_56_8]|nr:MAG: hypothetical protein A2Y73_03330 [Chloroflexi bacterium RBG_13_56_8]
MEHITNWTALWRELVETRYRSRHSESKADQDSWRERARHFDAAVKRRWAEPDSSRRFILSQIDENCTFLDIGAGTGAWAVALAPKTRRITAVEPSPAMIEVMRENLAAEGIENVDIVQDAWPDAEVGVHDLSLCSHAMYADFPRFIQRMIESTARTCFLLMRAPVANGVMALASRRVWGHPHDSPNFIIAYNILLEMDIFANVLMENTGTWGAWTNETMESAFDEIKTKLGLEGPSEHDDYLKGLLCERLTYQDGQYVWPPSMRSALVYWDVTAQ